MAIIFKELTKHDRLTLAPGVPTAFDDAGAEAYFVAARFADKTSDVAVVTYPEGSVEVDPETIFSDGSKVLEVQPVTSASKKGA